MQVIYVPGQLPHKFQDDPKGRSREISFARRRNLKNPTPATRPEVGFFGGFSPIFVDFSIFGQFEADQSYPTAIKSVGDKLECLGTLALQFGGGPKGSFRDLECEKWKKF